MKKLMMAVAVCCAAVAVQAASVKWDSATMYTPASADGGASTTKIAANATGYLFTLTAAEYNTFLAAYNSSGDMSKVWDTYKDSLTGGTASGARTSAVAITTTADVGDTVYGAVIYTTTATFDGVSKDFYIANIATGTVGSDAGITISGLSSTYLGTANGTVATGGWTAVPEPTSGLLMLLGMAGLALKRKRA